MFIPLQSTRKQSCEIFVTHSVDEILELRWNIKCTFNSLF